jgi:rhamnogalacturonyl hydrolase YesR
MREKIANSLERLTHWIETHDYKGYEPSDGNLSFLHPLTFEIPVFERILQQVIWKSPVDIRRLVGVRPHRSTKGMGYMASGYTLLYRLQKKEEQRKHLEFCLDWLMTNRAPRYEHYCWGDSFPFSSRGGRRPAFEPTIVWSSLIGHAYLDAHETVGNVRYLEVAGSICEWIKRLPRNETPSGLCLGYTALGRSIIHNSNMLGASLLARVGRVNGDKEALDLAREAMKYSCTRQNSDGSWAYGDGAKYAWIDSFHTGYNLDSLKCYMEHTGDKAYEQELQAGFEFFRHNFFETDGRPKYYHDRTYPIDIQCASQAIETLVQFRSKSEDAMVLAGRVASWTIDNMQDPDGHFYYRDLGYRKIKTPMFHWGQATMFKALAVLLSATEKDPAT